MNDVNTRKVECPECEHEYKLANHFELAYCLYCEWGKA